MLSLLLALAVWPDVFAEDFVERHARNVAAWADGNTIRLPHSTELFAAMQKLPGESAGRQRLIDFLKERYGYQLHRFHEVYRSDAQSFSDLLVQPFSARDKDRAGEDARELAREYIERYVEACGVALAAKKDSMTLMAPEPDLLSEASRRAWKVRDK
jgi:hypothetical protein